MCGIAGFWSERGFASDEMHNRLHRMTHAVRHRGPDDEGHWVDSRSGIGLGHQRLSIIDLSAAGHQPMVSHSGRFRIVFNGEIFNFEHLKQELKDVPWRGHSDTEVVLAAIERWGIVRAVQSFIGMFAFALWDRNEDVLYLVRDRLGIKPLYYGWCKNSFLFGSELHALREWSEFEAEIDRNSLALFMRHGYVPSPYSIYRGISKLPPGTLLTLRSASEKSWEPEAYWSAKQVADEGFRNPYVGTDNQAISDFQNLLSDSVRLRMLADVPVGAFLSGGIDSSLIVAVMQSHASRAVKTFNISFEDEKYNEGEYAARIARHLGTDHTSLCLTAQMVLAELTKVLETCDEPFADSSQIPMLLVSRLASHQVKVSLSGDGGDELFAGYTRYGLTERSWQQIGRIPSPIRGSAAHVMGALLPLWNDNLLNRIAQATPGSTVRLDKRRVEKFQNALMSSGFEALYRQVVSIWPDPESLVSGSKLPGTILSDSRLWPDFPDPTSQMMFVDLMTYLPDDILTKVDRATMYVGLEGRVPLLDHRVVEFAWKLPLRFKCRDNQRKWILRQVLDRYVPLELIERPKKGFSIPIAHWLRHELRDWAEGLLDANHLRSEGFLNVSIITKMWEEHLSGKANRETALWAVLVFQAWLHNIRGNSGTQPKVLAPEKPCTVQ